MTCPDQNIIAAFLHLIETGLVIWDRQERKKQIKANKCFFYFCCNLMFSFLSAFRDKKSNTLRVVAAEVAVAVAIVVDVDVDVVAAVAAEWTFFCLVS